MFHPTAVLRKLSCKSTRQQGLLVEAIMFLLLSRFLLALLPFRLLTKFMGRLPKKPEVVGPDRERLRSEVSWAVTAAAEHLPIKLACFPRGIAAQAMLRRRRVAAIMYLGVANLPERGLAAHVWVQDGTCGVIGHQIAGEYSVLMRFPNIL